MIHKLPTWVGVGGFLFSFIAGSINSVGLLGFKHQAVSHLTGVSTFLSLEIAAQNTLEIIHLLLIVCCFLIGAAISGCILGQAALTYGKRLGVVLAIECVLLLTAFLAFNLNSASGYYLASAACGLQNAITSIFSGSVIRTTHVSGLFTDLGIIIGLRIRGQKADGKKIALYGALIFGFISGGVVGAILFNHYGYDAILLSAALSLLVCFLYWFFIFSRYPTVQ